MTTLPLYVFFPVDRDDPENLQFVPTASANLNELKKATKHAEADFNKAAVELEETKHRWQLLQATLNMLTPIMEGKPEMTAAEAVALAGGSVAPE